MRADQAIESFNAIRSAEILELYCSNILVWSRSAWQPEVIGNFCLEPWSTRNDVEVKMSCFISFLLENAAFWPKLTIIY
jgi:hypothetical protein